MSFDGCLRPVSVILGLGIVSTPELKIRAECSNPARSDLCGGPGEIPVPTATGFVQVTLPYDVPLRAVYHSFEADSGGADFGHEFDFMVSKRFGRNWILTAKYAHYDGKDAPVRFDVDKVWAQLEFIF